MIKPINGISLKLMIAPPPPGNTNDVPFPHITPNAFCYQTPIYETPIIYLKAIFSIALLSLPCWLEPHKKCSAFRPGLVVYPGIMTGGDAVADSQTQPGAVFFGSIKGRTYFVDDFRR